MKYFINLFFIFCICTGFSQAQELTIPLSNPAKEGRLQVAITFGSIKVSGYNGKDVIISTGSQEKKDDCEGCPDKNKESTEGMKRIPNTSTDLTITEEDNKVKISGSHGGKRSNLNIKVPQKFSLKLSTVNNGDIVVENVEGDHEISNVNGSITLKSILGSAIANTVNGSIIVSFEKIKADTPMAFSGLNGKIDVTFPANVKASVKMKSEWGEIYSDFDMEMDKSDSNVKKTNSEGKTKYTIDNWVSGKINGGGAAMTFKNMHGNIYIRKK